MISDGFIKQNTDNHTINSALFLPKWWFVGMTESPTKSYLFENHCFTTVILKVFPLRTRKAKNNF